MAGDAAAQQPASLPDLAWRQIYRFGFPAARVWWGLRQRPHQGALVAVHVDDALLLLRSSYRREWNFPGGGVRRGETPEAAARRELDEEIGLSPSGLVPAGQLHGVWDGRPDTVHLFTLRLARLPELRLDNREIVAARLWPLDAARGLAVTGPVALYLRGAGPG